MTHPCSCCGGMPWSAFDPSGCPVCLGAGRISDVRTARDAMVDAETLRTALGPQQAQALLRARYHDQVIRGGYEEADNWLTKQPEFAQMRCPCGECGRAGRAWQEARTRHAPYGAPLFIGACPNCATGDTGEWALHGGYHAWIHRTVMQGDVRCARAAFRAVPALRGEA